MSFAGAGGREVSSCHKRRDCLPRLVVPACGGRAAEEVVFDSVTYRRTPMISSRRQILPRAMVTQYGMSEKFGLIGLESVQNRYLDGRTVMNCGEKTESEVDEEVMALLKQCYERAYHLIEENKDVLHELATYLVERETITGKEFVRMKRRQERK